MKQILILAISLGLTACGQAQDTTPLTLVDSYLKVLIDEEIIAANRHADLNNYLTYLRDYYVIPTPNNGEIELAGVRLNGRDGTAYEGAPRTEGMIDCIDKARLEKSKIYIIRRQIITAMFNNQDCLGLTIAALNRKRAAQRYLNEAHSYGDEAEDLLDQYWRAIIGQIPLPPGDGDIPPSDEE